MNTQSLIYQIALTQIKGVGNIVAKTLLAHVGNVEDIFKQSKNQLMKIPSVGEFIASMIISKQQEALHCAEKEAEFVLKNKITPLFFTDTAYPFRLKECVDAPVMLYSKGIQDYNQERFVAVVGTRKMTEYGKKLCTDFIQDLACNHKDIVIVSGLAYGADICAHKTALECGLNTVAVLGHGLDRIYPHMHRPTAAKMVTQGSLLTEYISGTNPDAPNFVQRNRIVAGMIDAVVVIETAQKGGSLITAEIANSYNRDVFAFPGNIGNEYSTGCNSLIKNNKAALIENAQDLTKLMGWESNKTSLKKVEPLLFVDLSEFEKGIIGFLKKSEIAHINHLVSNFEMPISRIAPTLLELEFKGLLRCLPGSLYKAVS